MAEEIRQITLRVPETLHRPARTKIADLDSSFQEVLIRLLQEWLSGEARKPDAVITTEPQMGKQRTEVELLLFILDHGTKDQAEWITGNLKTFAEAIRAKRAKAASDTPEEDRLVEEFRAASFEKRRRILAMAAKMEDLGPELMPPTKGSRSRSPDAGSSAPDSRPTVTPAPRGRRAAGK